MFLQTSLKYVFMLSSNIKDTTTFEMELCGRKQATTQAHVQPHCVCLNLNKPKIRIDQKENLQRRKSNSNLPTDSKKKNEIVQIYFRAKSKSAQNTLFMCSQKVSSFAPSLITAPGKSVVNLGLATFLDLVSFFRMPNLYCRTTAMNNLSPSILLRRLFSKKPGTIILTGLLPSFCWFGKSLSALIKLSHTPCGAACARNTFLHFGGPCCLL